jgi:hypothetical protein
MTFNDLVLFVLVAGGAFYAGYQVGRLKALAERGEARSSDDQPLPGPQLDRPYSEQASVPSSRQRSAPPPASAGSDGSWPEAGAQPSARTPPRRSTKPPPAAAGLMGTGEAEKSGKRQK